MTAPEACSPRRFVLPPALAAMGLSARAETEVDLPFLRRLYASTRWQEMALLPQWGDAEKLKFLDSQFDLQRHHYRTYYPETEWIVLEDTGVAAGRLYLYRGVSKFEVLDIALLPERRNRGIGTALMQAVCAQAQACNMPVRIAVEKFNPAQRLYRRLDFREVADEGPYWFMEWTAAVS